MKQVDIFTDGACHQNPGPGGWGAILRYKGKEKELSGANSKTTNNRMELTGVIEALKLLKEPCEVHLYSDSKYVCDGIAKDWAKKWQKNGWRKSNNKPALNEDLWKILLKLMEIHDVSVNWIKGHDGHPENERCDALASSAIKNVE
ncbi:MAG: ribonuclease HI [Oscillospiraceae bacterium]|nr:ribonuclease HI [Oscillospiraceae bacterium]